MIPQDFIQRLLDRTDIVEVIDRYVPLKKKGANYMACCPFHGEKTPSFTVSPTKQFYHCFGCGAHGTAISFLMEHSGMGFVDAVKDLASRAGLAVPDDGHGSRSDDGQRDRLLEAMDAAARFYRTELKASARAVAYLKGRGLTGEIAARFALGHAPDDWQGLAKAVADYQSTALEEAGLVIKGEGKRYDRFRDRIMFPIRNERGRVIAFGGRVLGQGEPKYLNSPETPLFHKGRELYGLFENRRAIQGSGRVVVVEGYMDVVMLAQHGVDNAVATLGTAVTPDHVGKLFRLVDDVVFAFDGDAAGRKAAWRGLENALPQIPDGKRAAFLFLPEGEDPDSFARAEGGEAFRRLCDRAKPLSDYLFAELIAQTDLASQEGKVRLVKLMEPYLQQLRQAPLLRRSLQRRLAETTGIAIGGMRSSLERQEAPTRQRRGVLPSPYRVLLQALLHSRERLASMPDELVLPNHPEAEALASLLAVMREHPEAGVRDLVEHFRGRPEQASIEAAAAGLLQWDEGYDVEADFQGALATL
ncbi:MAG: DNA primase, partial [Chromatiaceae bacterium]|nr:DNA primase [Candidatus Thioaporhodococcus sediminis]